MTYQNEQTAVRNLQKYLRQLSYTNPAITSPPIDGIFESTTKRSLMDFQKHYGIDQSGYADKTTWDLLYSEYLRSLAENSPPINPAFFPRTPFGYTVGEQDTSTLVSVIQLLLNEISVIYDFLALLEVTGVYDSLTADNVRYFQKRNRLPETGRVDKETWDSLVRAYNNYAADYVR